MPFLGDRRPQSGVLSTRRADEGYRGQRQPESIVHQTLRTSSPQAPVTDAHTISDQEMNTYTHALHLMRKKLQEAQEDVKSAREMAEKAKSELLSLEFKRGNVSQELGRLNNDIARRKAQLVALDTDAQAKAEEAKNMRSLGVTREDCLEIKAIKEDNVSLKSKLRNVEGLQLERDELVRQLEATKEDLFREQKHGRAKMEELQEEMDNLNAKLEETENNWSCDQAQLSKLETSIKKVEREKNELLQEKVKQYEDLRASLQEESLESESKFKKEMTDLDREVQDLRVKVNNLQLENVMKDAHGEKLRSEINEMGAIIDRERQEKQRMSVEQKKILENLKKETGSAVLRLKESMFLERQKVLEDIKKQTEDEKREAAARSEERLMHILDKHAYQLEAKTTEMSRLEEAIRRVESSRQMELEEQIIDAVQREREKKELEKEMQIREEREEEKRRNNELMATIDREQQANRDLQRDMTSLKKELDEHKKQQRDANKDRLVAVARAKDQMKEQGIAESERIKFNLKQEHESEMAKLKERIHNQEHEAHRVKSEMESISDRERQTAKTMEVMERMVVAEIHKECQRISNVTGVPARGMPSSSNFELLEGRQSPSFKNRPAINAALATLHGCIEDLQYAVSEMQQQHESLRAMVKSVTKEKEEAIESCRLEMDRQRIADLEKLKEKLLKDHVTEISNVIKDCAEANSQLKTNSEIMQRYGDAALLEALQAKDDELHTLQVTLDKWQGEMEEKFNTQLQLQIAKEREKYQALQHHSTREQKRIQDLQKREIDRLEKDLQKIVSSQRHDQDSNRFVTSPHSTHQEPALPTPSASSSLLPTSAANIKSSQRYLQNRIEQLQVENDALRKQRMVNSSRLSWSTSNLANIPLERPPSSLRRPLTPSSGQEMMSRLGDRMRPGDREAHKPEDRVKRNEKVTNNKMEEMAKLQNTLILQNKELQALERSYNDLQKHYLPRPSTPVRNLNTTL